ncbi:MAG: PDZ domain-containing protein, partial [Phycisphaerae bacterium]|nr:PDZ domain-containing protein [Phycisphaerae bacterium]
AQNIGFAIGVNRLRDLIPRLMNPSQANKLDLDVKLKEVRKIEEPATVTSAIMADGHDSPIHTIAGEKPRDIVDACAVLLRQEADKPFTIEFADGKSISITPKATPLPDAIVQAKQKLGLDLEQLTPMSSQKYGLTEDDGLLITGVARESIGGRAGVKAGDVIVQLGLYRISTLDDFAAVFTEFQKTETAHRRLRIVVRREGQVGVGVLQF